MPNIGLPELMLIAFLAMLFFGKDRLPGLAQGLGKSIKEFRSAVNIDGEEKKDAAIVKQEKSEEKAVSTVAEAA